MFNDSDFNTSVNISTLGEFPYWGIALSYMLVTELFIYSPIALFINASLLFTILKTKALRKPLNLIHLSLLSLNCLIIIPDAIVTCVYIPPVIRFCDCPKAASSVYFLIELLYIIFQPLNYACLGVFQLLLIRGKKRLVTYSSVTIAVIFCIGVATLLVLNGVTLINLANQTYVCNGFCPGESSRRFPGITYAFSAYTIVSWIPSSVVVLVCTIWSCCIFRSAYIGDNDVVSRRMISLPIVMPSLLVLPSIMSNAFLGAAEGVITSSGIAYSAYWIVFIRLVAFQVHELISGVAYPFVLLLLNPQIGKQWKKLVTTRCFERNRVVPEIVVTPSSRLSDKTSKRTEDVST
jgi:hypothetical protein